VLLKEIGKECARQNEKNVVKERRKRRKQHT
jgi:hypothetical protein